MRREDFHYELPGELIAQRPLAQRSASRLLHLDISSGRLSDRRVADLTSLLQPGDMLVFNDTRVIPARLFGHKQTGGAVEIFVERILGSRRFSAKLRASKTPRPGTFLTIGSTQLEVTGRQDDLFHLRSDRDVDSLLQAHGHIPLPPYIDRPDEAGDIERYQTVWARHDGAVAAPTAGLHFDDALLADLQKIGVECAYVTLHVGSGTYARVREQDISRHRLHSERIEVSQALCNRVQATRAAGGRIIAVGTTVVRSLESAARTGSLLPYAGETDIFIKPGDAFNVVDGLITNFHEPESTLLMLVSAFAGHAEIMAAYRHAVAARYRFLSYGDAMFID